MSEIDRLLDVLRGQRSAHEWVATARVRSSGAVRRGAGGVDERRVDERTELAATVHRDLPAGRGSARVRTIGGDLDAAVAAAIERAATAVGPPWQMAAPAAPAQVETEDETLAAGDADDVAQAIAQEIADASRAPELTRLAGGAVAIADVEVVVARETVDLASSQGLHVQWRSTEARAAITLVSGGRTTIARVRGRRHGGLGLAAALAGAAERLGGLARAVVPPAGAYSIVLRLEALAPDDGGIGLWAAFAAQADATLVRQGLSRYRPGHRIVEDGGGDLDLVTVISDGTLPFGLASTPLGDDAEPVRRFALVERGVARGVAYDQREAALAGARPNGGVRNVVVEPGATPAAEIAASAGGPVIDVTSLAWIDLDPRTGQASAGVEYGYLRAGGAGGEEATPTPTPTPIVGVVIGGDVIAALARGRRSAETAERGAYRGPIAIRVEGLAVS